jgi:hypothetical protein
MKIFVASGHPCRIPQVTSTHLDRHPFARKQTRVPSCIARIDVLELLAGCIERPEGRGRGNCKLGARIGVY